MTTPQPWHPTDMKRFERIPVNPRESDFYAPFNMLLQGSSLFPADSDFTVVPQCSDSNTNVDFPIEFVVLYGIKPIFFLQINEPGRICYPSARRSADVRMRNLIGDLITSCPIQTLDGVCTFGKNLCFYRVDRQILRYTFPFVAEGERDIEVNPAPLEHWNYDVLEQNGADQLRSVVEKIKEACGKIECPWSA